MKFKKDFLHFRRIKLWLKFEIWVSLIRLFYWRFLDRLNRGKIRISWFLRFSELSFWKISQFWQQFSSVLTKFLSSSKILVENWLFPQFFMKMWSKTQILSTKMDFQKSINFVFRGFAIFFSVFGKINSQFWKSFVKKICLHVFIYSFFLSYIMLCFLALW